MKRFVEFADAVTDRIDCVNTLQDFENKHPQTDFSYRNSEMEYYYTIMNLSCQLGSLKKMYVPNTMDENGNLQENQRLNEQRIGRHLNVKAKSKILELGCGIGRIAYDMSNFLESKVYGINLNTKHIEQAREYAKLMGKESDLSYHFGDINAKFDFEDNFFDGVYEIQVCGYAKNQLSTFSEIYRVLKPGCRFAFTDVVLLDNFDKNNSHHMKLLRDTRTVIGGAGMWHYKYWEKAAQDAGFNIIMSCGDPLNENIKAPEVLMVTRENNKYENVEFLINCLTKSHIIPKHHAMLIERFRKGAQSYIEAAENELITIGWNFIFEKPKN